MDIHVENLQGSSTLDAEAAVALWRKAKAITDKMHKSDSNHPALVLLQANSRGSSLGKNLRGSGTSARANRQRLELAKETPNELDASAWSALGNVVAGSAAEEMLVQILEKGSTPLSAESGRSFPRFKSTRMGEISTVKSSDVAKSPSGSDSASANSERTTYHFETEAPSHPSGMLLRLPPGFWDRLVGSGEPGSETEGETQFGRIGQLHLTPERDEAIRRSLASLAIRANGTLACLCQQAGVPVAGLGPFLLHSSPSSPNGALVAKAPPSFVQETADAPDSRKKPVSKSDTMSDPHPLSDPSLESDPNRLSDDPLWMTGNDTAPASADVAAVKMTAAILSPAPSGIAMLTGSAMLDQTVAEEAARLLRDADEVRLQLESASGPLPSDLS